MFEDLNREKTNKNKSIVENAAGYASQWNGECGFIFWIKD
jgi:hypothetical protein